MKRTEHFKRNPALEEHIEFLNNLLLPAETIADIPEKPQLPVILIMGNARSGTTLMSQWLAASEQFAYPSNLIARMHKNTYVAANIHRLLVDPLLNFRGEFSEIKPFDYDNSFQSDIGKTSGLAAPNVFWYFWRNYFPFGDISHLDDTQESLIDTEGFLRGLSGLEAGFGGRPVVMKGMIANWNIPLLDRMLPKVLFIHMKRSPYFNAQSILLARERFSGSRQDWWSFKPPEYDTLRKLSPIEQVAGQVYYTDKAVSDAGKTVDDARWLEIGYEQFCKHPKSFYDMIRAKIMRQSQYDIGSYRGPDHIPEHNRQKLTDPEMKELKHAYDSYTQSGI